MEKQMTIQGAIKGLKACPDHRRLWKLDELMTAAFGRPVLDIDRVHEVLDPLTGADESMGDAAARLYGELFRDSLRYLLDPMAGEEP